jgi:putative chitinase
MPAYMTTPAGAAMSAGWFWASRNLNALADQILFTKITQRINGGINGLAERKQLWATVRAVLASAA